MKPITCSNDTRVLIKPESNEILVIVKMSDMTPFQLHTPEVKEIVKTKANFTVHYLVEEGFVDNPYKWSILIFSEVKV